MKAAALLVSVAVDVGAILMAAPANAEILSYECVVGQLKIELRVDTALLEVTEATQVDGTPFVGRYSDGVFGRISEFGPAQFIPPVHQFVRIDGQKIWFGAELKGIKESALLDRETATLTIPSGKSGWCTKVEK
jgi:hypothetical protein